MVILKNVSKNFPGCYKPSIADMTFSLNAGDFCVVIGSNGAGKSTLARLISGDYVPSSGSIILNGDIAQVVQDVTAGTIAELTVLENIVLSIVQKPIFSSYKHYKNQAISFLEEFGIGLENYIDTPLKFLSGGQRQIIATIMAINSGRKILLLDEHTSALDPKTQDLLMNYTVKKALEKNFTTLMITHNMNHALYFGNKLIMLHQGKIVLELDDTSKRNMKVSELIAYFRNAEDQILCLGD